MHTTPKLQEHLLAIAQKHNLDVHQVGAYLRLDLNGAEHYLVIENLGACRLSVSRYVLGSKGVVDPELILYLDCRSEQDAGGQSCPPWIPIERVQRLGGWAIFAQTDVSGNLVNQFDPQGQRDLAEFAETVFLPTLMNQGWLPSSRRSHLPKPYLTEDEQWARGIAYPYNTTAAAEVSKLMPKVALRMATDHEVDLLAPTAQLTLTLPRRPLQLQLRKLDDERIAITRYVVDEVGKLVPDPELVFRIEAGGEWQSEELLYSPAVWDEYLQAMQAAGRPICSVDGEVDLVSFTAYWAQQLVDEGWLQQGHVLPSELGVMPLVDSANRAVASAVIQRCNKKSEMADDTQCRFPGCQSTHHTLCYRDLWTCSGCGMTFCSAERTDDYTELCVDCVLGQSDLVSGEEYPGVGVSSENSFIVVCDCYGGNSFCGTWLELGVDGMLAIEDKDGMRLSISLPDWLDTAIRQAMQNHNHQHDEGVPF